MHTLTCPLAVLAAARPTVSSDAGRPIVHGMALYHENDRVVMAASTDSYQLTVATAGDGFSTIEEMTKMAFDLRESYTIMRTTVVDAALKAARHKDHKQARYVRFSWDGDTPGSRSGVTWELLLQADQDKPMHSVTMMDQVIEGDYPQIHGLMATTPTFVGHESYAFNPQYLATPYEIDKQIKHYVGKRKGTGGRITYNTTHVVWHGTSQGKSLQPLIATMHRGLDTDGVEGLLKDISILFVLMPVRFDSNLAFKEGTRTPTDAPVIVDKWVADNAAQYDYTVDTPCKPMRSSYTVDPDGDAAFALAWRKWINHCEWVADEVEPCPNDPRYAWWMKNVAPGIEGATSALVTS